MFLMNMRIKTMLANNETTCQLQIRTAVHSLTEGIHFVYVKLTFSLQNSIKVHVISPCRINKASKITNLLVYLVEILKNSSSGKFINQMALDLLSYV